MSDIYIYIHNNILDNALSVQCEIKLSYQVSRIDHSVPRHHRDALFLWVHVALSVLLYALLESAWDSHIKIPNDFIGTTLAVWGLNRVSIFNVTPILPVR